MAGNRGHSSRNRNLFRRLHHLVGGRLDDGVTVVARVVDGIFRINSDRLEITAEEGILTYLLQTGRNEEIIRFNIIHESLLPNYLQTLRQVNALQSGTREGSGANLHHALGNTRSPTASDQHTCLLLIKRIVLGIIHLISLLHLDGVQRFNLQGSTENLCHRLRNNDRRNVGIAEHITSDGFQCLRQYHAGQCDTSMEGSIKHICFRYTTACEGLSTHDAGFRQVEFRQSALFSVTIFIFRHIAYHVDVLSTDLAGDLQTTDAIALTLRNQRGQPTLFLKMHLTIAYLGLLLITDIIVRSRLDAHHSSLILRKVRTLGRFQVGQGKVTVHAATPAPVHIELTVLIAVKHKGVTCLTAESAVDDGATQFYLMVERLFPLPVGKLLTAHLVGTLTEVENRDEGAGDGVREGCRLIKAVIHHDSLTAIAHQPGDIIIAHAEPVELTGRQTGHLHFLIPTLLNGIAHRLTDIIQRPLEKVDHLCHGRCHTTCERLLTVDLRAMGLIHAGLIPSGVHQGGEFSTTAAGPAFGGTVGRYILQRLGHLGIVVEEPFHIIGRIREVEMPLLGIAQHLRHEVVGRNDHKATILFCIKHIVGFVVAGGTAVRRLHRQLLTLQNLAGLLHGLVFRNLSCKHG